MSSCKLNSWIQHNLRFIGSKKCLFGLVLVLFSNMETQVVFYGSKIVRIIKVHLRKVYIVLYSEGFLFNRSKLCNHIVRMLLVIFERQMRLVNKMFSTVKAKRLLNFAVITSQVKNDWIVIDSVCPSFSETIYVRVDVSVMSGSALISGDLEMFQLWLCSVHFLKTSEQSENRWKQKNIGVKNQRWFSLNQG